MTGVLTLSFEESAGFSAPPAFGPYRVLHQIGSGVLGPVFRTHEPGRDRLIAVKAFRLDLLPEDAARLADSLRQLVAAGLVHPNVVSPIDAGLEGTSPFLAMDYVAGETLDVALRRMAPSPLVRALPLLWQAARAIEAAHVLGFGHGALHPRDLFLAPQTSDVRVTGFGVLSALEAVGVKPPIRRPYAAPERADGGHWDIRADVYSLGAIAHELLTRRRPASAGEQDAGLTPDTTPEARVAIRRVLAKALATRPPDRFATPTAFVGALDAIARGVEAAGENKEANEEANENQENNEELRWSDEGGRPDETRPIAEDAPIDESVPIAAPHAIVATEPSGVAERTTGAAADGQTNWWAPDRVQPAESYVPPASSAPLPPSAPPSAPLAPPPMFGVIDPPLHRTPPAQLTVSSRFPWLAVMAAGVIGVVLGVAIGYEIVRTLGDTPSIASSAAKPSPDASAPTDTEVPVSAPPVSAASAPTVATSTRAAATEPAPPPRAEPAPPRPRAPAKPTPTVVSTVAMGRLLVRSVPAGAQILIDGRARGATPLALRDLPFGSHTLLIVRNGYESATERIVLTQADPVRNLTFELRPVRVTRPPERPPLAPVVPRF